ncbi:NAD-dependent epimerase/dehydratase family protein [Elizabethkingia meningoseptica]|uniref:NAD-dependent epimerase/dehydratase family protein n=1 Tax=Elizabethkingia meningoseptica TaxID=238 RepID=UPI00099A3646|nr:NAD-dependent epimerase/dehydratase family protein [Elizabethkingia meningoseptica]EJK5328204.1 NAD-dependent epimerase/dehydratase family protein [Elizabethkingia meningoseptica]MDE5437187.1 NAD-dependent epimerase/dehydratase family protein [Elizabethkingia meningoseptica]MDE5509683.1 NAD-dependent epimerase/dehydratase family protein [Elizabethkingia meningoseptica]MDE5514304.1 NAD-dependent epimerase/dehydratase family protein [Elizabethkingia meningoseptica]MDE5524951.1 NAD-dependent e
MQTILGANGQIGEELARELKRNFTSDIRIVSRNAKKINETDQVFSADLSIREQAVEAVKGSDIAYFTLGLPISSDFWEEQFPLITKNVIEACKINGTKLVFFDNTYMYPQDDRVLKEDTAFAPVGRKGRVRREMAEMVLKAIHSGEIEAVICRAPEFYGPGKTQSITNTLIFNNIKEGKKLKVPLSADKKRSLIWTPDASRATALIGNTPDAFGQTWHLPVDKSHATYREFIRTASEVYSRDLKYSVIPKFIFNIGALFNKKLKELLELLPRYEHDNIFDDSKFRSRFPEFQVTSYTQGITIIKNEQLLKDK